MQLNTQMLWYVLSGFDQNPIQKFGIIKGFYTPIGVIS